MFLAHHINERIENAKPNIVGNKPYYLITKALRDSFCEKDLKFKFETFEDFNKDTYNVSGLYDMHNDVRYICFNFSSLIKTININNQKWEEFKFQTSQVIQHETIHKYQWQTRDVNFESEKVDFRSLVVENDEEERSYLSDVDEIDAYAHDIAMELKHYYPRKNPYVILNKISKTRKVPSYTYYTKTFKNCEWQKIRKKLIQKTYKWIKHV